MRFEVEVDGIDLGGWATCTGLAVDFGLKEITEGGTNGHSVWLPDRIKYEPITLTRAMSAGDSARLALWLARFVDAEHGGTARISLRDAHYATVASWNLRNVRPKSWKGPSMAGDSTQVAVETLVLAHEGFLDDGGK